jgi:RimJ/RimL family protein N-acetyltransferase
MGKRAITPLVNGPVRLRLLEEADLPMTREWRNQDHIRRWFFHSDVISPEQHLAWYAQYKQKDDDFVFVIEETEALKSPVGQIALYGIDRQRRSAELGRLLIGVPEAASKGLARLAVSRLVDEAFGEWGLSEVHLEVMSNNAAALAVYRACGFHAAPEDGAVVRMTRVRPQT